MPFFKSFFKTLSSLFKRNKSKKQETTIQKRRDISEAEKFITSGEIFLDYDFIFDVYDMYTELLNGPGELGPRIMDSNGNRIISCTYKFPIESGPKGAEQIHGLNRTGVHVMSKLFRTIDSVEFSDTSIHVMLMCTRFVDCFNRCNESKFSSQVVSVDRNELVVLNGSEINPCVRDIVNYGIIICKTNVNLGEIMINNQGALIVMDDLSVRDILNNGYLMNMGEIDAKTITNNGIYYNGGSVNDIDLIESSGIMINVDFIIGKNLSMDNHETGRLINAGIIRAKEFNDTGTYVKQDFGTIQLEPENKIETLDCLQ